MVRLCNCLYPTNKTGVLGGKCSNSVDFSMISGPSGGHGAGGFLHYCRNTDSKEMPPVSIVNLFALFNTSPSQFLMQCPCPERVPIPFKKRK